MSRMGRTVPTAFRPLTQDGLVAWIEPFGKTNEDADRATIIDKSGNGNHATLTGFDWTETDGYINGTLINNKTDDLITVPISAYTGVSQDWSFEIVVDIPSQSFPINISLVYSTLNTARALALRTVYNTIQFANGTLTYAGLPSATTPAAYDTEVRKHDSVFTLGTSIFKSYWNGGIYQSYSATKLIGFGNTLLIGTSAIVKLISFCAYNRILTDEEVYYNHAYNKMRYGI